MKRKILATLLLCTILMMSTFTNALAATITPMYVPDFTVYRHSSDSKYRVETWSHETNNKTSLTRTVTYSVSRTLSTSFTGAYENVIDTMIAKVGVSFEVSIGTSTTRTTTINWNIPGNSSWLLSYGNQVAYVAGYADYYVNNKLHSSKFVTGTWTFSSYDDMIRLN